MNSIVRSSIKHTKQLGFTAIELLVVLIVAVGGLVLGGDAMNRYTDTLANQSAADHGREVIKASQKYIKDNYAPILAAATATTPAVVTVAMLQSTSYLPASMTTLNNYGQDYSILVLQPSAGKLEALILTTGGETIPELGIRRIAQLMGAQGGFVSSITPANATGSYGGWSIGLPGNYGVSPGAGHLAMALFFADSGTVSDYVYRNAVAGHPELNEMNTPLVMNSVQTVNDACSQPGAIGRDAAGAVLSCQAGQWKTQGSAYWQDPVETYAALPSCTVGTASQTRVVTTPTVGSGPRAYTCNGASWAALAVDDSGNIVIAGTAAAGKVFLSDIAVLGSACSPNGLLSRDSVGQILSCQSGVYTRHVNVTGDMMTGRLGVSTNDWGIALYDGSGGANGARLDPVGSAYVNDLYFRSSGRWLSQLFGGHYATNIYVGCYIGNPRAGGGCGCPAGFSAYPSGQYSVYTGSDSNGYICQ